MWKQQCIHLSWTPAEQGQTEHLGQTRAEASRKLGGGQRQKGKITTTWREVSQGKSNSWVWGTRGPSQAPPVPLPSTPQCHSSINSAWSDRVHSQWKWNCTDKSLWWILNPFLVPLLYFPLVNSTYGSISTNINPSPSKSHIPEFINMCKVSHCLGFCCFGTFSVIVFALNIHCNLAQNLPQTVFLSIHWHILKWKVPLQLTSTCGWKWIQTCTPDAATSAVLPTPDRKTQSFLLIFASEVLPNSLLIIKRQQARFHFLCKKISA